MAGLGLLFGVFDDALGANFGVAFGFGDDIPCLFAGFGDHGFAFSDFLFVHGFRGFAVTNVLFHVVLSGVEVFLNRLVGDVIKEHEKDD